MASLSTSMPALANAASTSSQLPPSGGNVGPISPWSAKAFNVVSGMVLTVKGEASALTYKTSDHFGFLVPVLPHNNRCDRAPKLYARSQRGEASKVWYALYVRFAMAIPS